MAKISRNKVAAAENSICKVKGEKIYLGLVDGSFTIVTGKGNAAKFTEAYANEIAASKWGGKDWEVKSA